jgi:hypothetical protein
MLSGEDEVLSDAFSRVSAIGPSSVLQRQELGFDLSARTGWSKSFFSSNLHIEDKKQIEIPTE